MQSEWLGVSVRRRQSEGGDEGRARGRTVSDGFLTDATSRRGWGRSSDVTVSQPAQLNLHSPQFD